MKNTMLNLLAAQDALLMAQPGERPGLQTTANRRAQHSAMFRKMGLPWQARRYCSHLTAKQADRILSELISEGLVSCAGGTRKRTHAKLTAKGHSLARSWLNGLETAPAQFADETDVFDLLQKLRAAEDRALFTPTGCPWWKMPRGPGVERVILFGMGLGWLATQADSYGVVLLSITTKGDKIDSMPEPDDHPPISRKERAELQGLYDEAFEEAVDGIERLPILDTNDVAILNVFTVEFLQFKGGAARPTN